MFKLFFPFCFFSIVYHLIEKKNSNKSVSIGLTKFLSNFIKITLLTQQSNFFFFFYWAFWFYRTVDYLTNRSPHRFILKFKLFFWLPHRTFSFCLFENRHWIDRGRRKRDYYNKTSVAVHAIYIVHTQQWNNQLEKEQRTRK